MSNEPERRTIVITDHAIHRYFQRRNETGSWAAVEREIRERVETGFRLRGHHVLNHRPDGFVLYGQKRGRLAANQRFVRDSLDADVGFIVSRERDTDYVLTTLTRAGVRR